MYVCMYRCASPCLHASIGDTDVPTSTRAPRQVTHTHITEEKKKIPAPIHHTSTHVRLQTQRLPMRLERLDVQSELAPPPRALTT